ncbi:MAG: transcriptional repressor [Tannerellaceae bacterium]|jgi:Fur family ferric uptake transcriptional regulator|nr:transcriptional repressor [Tannerellaceae bacterium]
MTENHAERLEARGIKPTAIRLLVLRTMLEHPQAFSLPDMETRLDTVDKSTLFRTISLFRRKLLIHSIDDGSGSIKYSVCRSDCTCSLKDLHVHFTCTRCKKTFCLENISIPAVQLPPGFQLENVNFVLKGLCRRCSAGG